MLVAGIMFYCSFLFIYDPGVCASMKKLGRFFYRVFDVVGVQNAQKITVGCRRKIPKMLMLVVDLAEMNIMMTMGLLPAQKKKCIR